METVGGVGGGGGGEGVGWGVGWGGGGVVNGVSGGAFCDRERTFGFSWGGGWGVEVVAGDEGVLGEWCYYKYRLCIFPSMLVSRKFSRYKNSQPS